MEIKIIPFLFKTRTAFILFKGNIFFFFFLREIKLITSTPNYNFLSLDQNTSQFLMQVKIELQISYSTIRNFIN